jgi:glyoxylase-like metal-dependent hydrolase (beta-lactamase superfamily II)
MSTWKFILLLILLCPSLIYAKLMDKQFNVSKYGDSTFVLIGNDYGTNVGVIFSSKGLLLIDPMPGEQSFETLHLLIKGISNHPISYVVNTHNHEDHTGGNEYFKSNGASILSPNSFIPKLGLGSEKLLFSKHYGLEVIKVESHTNQDIMYFNSESNVLFVGDVFDNSWHPTFYAGGIDGLTKTIDTILAVGDRNTLIVPGHGVPANKEVVKAFYENTLVWLERVSELLKADMSVEQIMKDKQINEILQRFNTEKRKEFIPPKAFRRFIERTISIVSSKKEE